VKKKERKAKKKQKGQAALNDLEPRKAKDVTGGRHNRNSLGTEMKG
jgi:hypothetical protein